jgi:hypothetical protein
MPFSTACYASGAFTIAGRKVSPGIARARIRFSPDHLVLHANAPGNHTNTLTFGGVPNFPYVVQYATNLTDSPWFTLSTNAPAANGVGTAIDSAATDPQRFYRVGYQESDRATPFHRRTRCHLPLATCRQRDRHLDQPRHQHRAHLRPHRMPRHLPVARPSLLPRRAAVKLKPEQTEITDSRLSAKRVFAPWRVSVLECGGWRGNGADTAFGSLGVGCSMAEVPLPKRCVPPLPHPPHSKTLARSSPPFLPSFSSFPPVQSFL